MAIDAAGHIVWEESSYDPASRTYQETVWQLSRGRLSRRFGPVSRPSRGLGIIRDRQGCTWHSDQAGRVGRSLVHRLCPGRPPVRLVGSAADDARFRPELINDLGGTLLAPDGRFMFRHGGTIRSVDPRGLVRLVASGLAVENFGIALDQAGRLLVAEHGNRRVVRISGRQRQVVAASAPGWAPTGVTARRDAIHVLEASDHRPGRPPRVRVGQIGPDGRARMVAEVEVPQP